MGSESAVAPRYAVGKQTLSTSADATTAATPGKRTLAEHAPGLAGDVVAQVKAYAGETISDGGGYTFRVTDAGAFEVIAVPPGHDNSKHQLITLETYAHAWQVVAQRLLARPPVKPAANPLAKPAPAAPAPQPSWFARAVDALEAELDDLHHDASSIWSRAKSFLPSNDSHAAPSASSTAPQSEPVAATPARVPAPAPATPAAELPAELEQKNNHINLKAIPLAAGDVARVSPWSQGGAKLVTREHRFEQPGTQEKLAVETYVRIVRVDGDIALVEKLDGPSAPSGTEFGWVRKTKLVRLDRAPRPTTAAAQMDRLADIASTHHAAAQQGICFTYVKNYIALAGGYGDIRDLHTDPRFDGLGVGGKEFATFVEAIGLAELGLAKVEGAIADQRRGTIVCTKGNGKNGIHATYGDIAVVDKTEGGVTICYNDAIIPFATAASEWQSGGRLEGSIVGMYRPVDRK